jgi:hypothetical protein
VSDEPLRLHLHASPMLRGAVRCKVFLNAHDGILLGTFHAPRFVFDRIVYALEHGAARLTMSGPYLYVPAHPEPPPARADPSSAALRSSDPGERALAAIRAAQGAPRSEVVKDRGRRSQRYDDCLSPLHPLR